MISQNPSNLLKTNNTRSILILLVVSLTALCLTNCNPQDSTPVATQATITPVDISQPSIGSISANGVLLPNHQLLLSFGSGSFIESVAVELGENVQAGQTLVQLETTQARMAVKQAEMELAIAQENYDLVESNLPLELSATMAAADLELMVARQALDRLYSNADTARVTSYNEMVAAQQAVGDVKYQLYYFTIPSTLKGNDPIEALEFAIGQLDQARADYEPYKNQPDEEVPRLNRNPNPRDEYQQRLKDKLDGAQRDYNSALRWFELEAALADAEVRLTDAKKEHERLQNGPDPDKIALAEARVANAQAQLNLVSGESQTAEQLNLAQEKVEAAHAQLQEARTQLEQLRLQAPLDGVISAIHIDEGEWAMPGAVVVEMLDLSSWQVETKNVGELEIGRVKIGQTAQVRFNAFQAKTVNGQVKAISPESVVQQGDITYTLVIALEPTDLNLRPGMTARVEISIE